MASTDPIADMLTTIRNANQKFKEKVDIPSSKMKCEIARMLKENGFIANFKNIEDRKQGILRIYLKYSPSKERVIKGITRISRPGLRVYRSWNEIPKIYGGLGTIFLSTSKGLINDEQARMQKVGGELLCKVW